MAPDGFEDVTGSVAFGTARTPSEVDVTFVVATVTIGTDGTEGTVGVDVDGVTVASPSQNVNAGALTDTPNIIADESVPFLVPDGGTYTLRNVADPLGANAIDRVSEAQL